MVINYKSIEYEHYDLINKKINELDKLLNSINRKIKKNWALVKNVGEK